MTDFRPNCIFFSVSLFVPLPSDSGDVKPLYHDYQQAYHPLGHPRYVVSVMMSLHIIRMFSSREKSCLAHTILVMSDMNNH